jgi:hypothetical protein
MLLSERVFFSGGMTTDSIGVGSATACKLTGAPGADTGAVDEPSGLAGPIASGICCARVAAFADTDAGEGTRNKRNAAVVAAAPRSTETHAIHAQGA